MNPIKQFEKLQSHDQTYWIRLLNHFLVKSNNVVVKGVPSIKEQRQNAQDELERIEKQRKTLGPAGLERKGIELMKAMEQNEIPPPIEMLTQVPIPGIEGVHFHSVTIYRANDGVNPPGLDFKQLPVFAEAYDVHTNFVYVNIYLFNFHLD